MLAPRQTSAVHRAADFLAAAVGEAASAVGNPAWLI